MSVARTWRQSRQPAGPQTIRDEDIPELNEVFSEAFTDRYRRDGMAGVRVPHLNPPVWRFAIADAGEGARLWRDDRGKVIAFNVAHLSGTEGWMGPLAVHPDHQGHGLGKSVVSGGVEYLRAGGAKVIGLETMPRTMDNIGFYSSLGMNPGYLTLTLTVDASFAGPMTEDSRALRLGTLTPDERDHAIRECTSLTESILPGYDFCREIQLTEELAIGDTLTLMRGDSIAGFALCHSVPLVEGRVREELRVLKLVVRSEDDFDLMVTILADHARRSGTRRVALRMQGQYPGAYRRLMGRAPVGNAASRASHAGAVSWCLSPADGTRRESEVVGPADDARWISRSRAARRNRPVELGNLTGRPSHAARKSDLSAEPAVIFLR